jgi:hypothetical protein
VLISSGGLSGFETGAAPLNPYQGAVNHLRQAAQLRADGLRFANQYVEDAVLGTLDIAEIAALDHLVRLQLVVDAAVALFHAAGVPGNVEMKQVPTMACRR